MNKWLIIGGVALAVVLLSRRAQADPKNPYDVRNWDALPGYSVGSGAWL